MDNFEYDYDERTKTLESKHEPKSPFLAMVGVWGLIAIAIGLMIVFPIIPLIILCFYLIHKFS